MKSEIKIIKADKSLIKDWVLLRIMLWPNTTQKQHLLEIKDILRTKKNIVLIIFINKKAVGFVECEFRSYADGCLSGDIPYLEGWYILNKYRKIGLGKKILIELIKILKKRGYKEMASDCEINNKLSYKAHRALGFIEIKRLVHFKKKI